MARTNSAIFMHCLPVRRNVIVTDGVIDSASSVVIDEAENRLARQKAIMKEVDSLIHWFIDSMLPESMNQ